MGSSTEANEGVSHLKNFEKFSSVFAEGVDVIGEMMDDDMALVGEFTRSNSEEAFAELVRRHINLVYSVAHRHVGNSHLAEDITQSVFIVLARKAGTLDPKTILPAWLCRTARYVSIKALKMQHRRERREHEAFMQSHLNEPEPEAWRKIAPMLDDALDCLGKKDHSAVVLRFFEGRDLKQVGAALGLGEDAARMRVNRAIERLRKFFLKRGVALSAAAVAGAVSANAVHAAPTALAKSATAVGVAKGSIASGSNITLVKGALKIMAWTNAKTAITATAAIVLVAATTAATIEHLRGRSAEPQAVPSGQMDFPKSAWHFAGYDNPESTLESCMWAASNGDVKTLLGGVSPEMQKKFAGMLPEQIISAKDREEYDSMTGYQIVDKEVVSADEVVFRVHTQGLEQDTKFSLQRIGGQWRFGGKPDGDSDKSKM